MICGAGQVLVQLRQFRFQGLQLRAVNGVRVVPGLLDERQGLRVEAGNLCGDALQVGIHIALSFLHGLRNHSNPEEIRHGQNAGHDEAALAQGQRINSCGE